MGGLSVPRIMHDICMNVVDSISSLVAFTGEHRVVTASNVKNTYAHAVSAIGLPCCLSMLKHPIVTSHNDLALFPISSFTIYDRDARLARVVD